VRSIGVVTGARSDYGLYRPILRQLHDDPDIDLRLFVGGMHLSQEFGYTVTDIEKDGFPIAERIDMLVSSDSPVAIATSIGLGVIGYARAFERSRPDILLVIGDRFDMLAAATAAIPLNIPLAHIHGGESTEGLIDEPIRHSITKMSHLHFAATAKYAQRIMQMGEEPWRVTVSGAPGLDNLADFVAPSLAGLAEFGVDLDSPPLIVTYHPVTLDFEDTARQTQNLMTALDSVGMPVVFTYPNADTNGRVIIDAINAYVSSHQGAYAVAHLGTQGYFGLMANGAAMVGNSSSGIIEAASFGLPVVDIGDRQRGRVHDANVINVGYETADIIAGITRVTTPDFSSVAKNVINPYGDGHAAGKIVQVLKTVEINKALLFKHFHDPSETAS
jgi:UDP-N-acetylglucosamine 2-epimerase (non-hydrolysing)